MGTAKDLCLTGRMWVVVAGSMTISQSEAYAVAHDSDGLTKSDDLRLPLKYIYQEIHSHSERNVLS